MATMTKHVSQLMADLAQLGISLAGHGDRLRYSPRSAVTPYLAERMKAHKAELLAILQSKRDKVTDCDEGAFAMDTDPWESPTAIPASSVEPCPTCGSLELWWNPLDEARCLRCDPPGPGQP